MTDDFDIEKFTDEVLGPMPPDTPERHRHKQDSADSQALSERWGEVARYVAKETDMNAGETPSFSYVEFLEDNIRDALEKEHELARTTAIADFLARVEGERERLEDLAQKTYATWWSKPRSERSPYVAREITQALISELRAIAGPAQGERE